MYADPDLNALWYLVKWLELSLSEWLRAAAELASRVPHRLRRKRRPARIGITIIR